MKKLTLIQSELKAPKNQYNNFGKYKYRNQEDILEAVKPLLKKHECSLVVTDEIIEMSGILFVKASAIFSDESEIVTVNAYAKHAAQKKGMDDAQISGATSSYARKYALNGLFLIDDTKDADTVEHRQETDAKYQLTEKTQPPVKKGKITKDAPEFQKTIDYVYGEIKKSRLTDRDKILDLQRKCISNTKRGYDMTDAVITEIILQVNSKLNDNGSN